MTVQATYLCFSPISCPRSAFCFDSPALLYSRQFLASPTVQPFRQWARVLIFPRVKDCLDHSARITEGMICREGANLPNTEGNHSVEGAIRAPY